VVIRASSGKQVEALVAALAADDVVRREAAVARLIVIGARAVDRLVALVESNAPTASRAAALRVLEAIEEPRGLDAPLAATDDRDSTLVLQAIASMRAFLRGSRGADALDRLTRIALDTSRDERVRTAAIAALSDLDASTLQPLWASLKQDPNAAVRHHVEALAKRSARTPAVRDPVDELNAAAEGGLPDDPAAVRDALVQAAHRVALPRVHRILERIREREAAEPAGSRRAEWTRARGAAHVVLANRGSRLAVYDLRESLESAVAPLPVDFLAALSRVGDVSCLEPIAVAYARSRRPAREHHDWWCAHLADAFRAIVAREKVTRRHRTVMKLAKRSRGTLEELWPGRSGRRPT
jgi:HEAT repeat protein